MGIPAAASETGTESSSSRPVQYLQLGETKPSVPRWTTLTQQRHARIREAPLIPVILVPDVPVMLHLPDELGAHSTVSNGYLRGLLGGCIFKEQKNTDRILGLPSTSIRKLPFVSCWFVHGE